MIADDPMPPNLHLTADEQKIFDALPATLKEGWTVEKEASAAYERPEELLMRYRMASFHNPACQAIAEKAKGAKTAQDIERIAASFDPSALSLPELSELLFTLGTKWLSHMLRYLLAHTSSDEDIEGIATLSHIRHMLFEANASVS